MRAMKAYRFLAFMIAVLVVVQAGAIAWAFFRHDRLGQQRRRGGQQGAARCDDCEQEFTAEWGFAIQMFFTGWSSSR